MGRGRQKAKQQKVARELKYNSPHTDLDRLAQELRGSPSSTTDTAEYDADEDDNGDEDGGRWANGSKGG